MTDVIRNGCVTVVTAGTQGPPGPPGPSSLIHGSPDDGDVPSWNATTGQWEAQSMGSENKTTRAAYDANGNIQYFGQAMPGSATSSAAWKIQKYLYDASNNFLSAIWADGDLKFDNVWDDRATLNYS